MTAARGIDEFPDLPPNEWDPLEGRVRAFEAALIAGDRPSLVEHLADEDPLGGQLLVELIHAELEFRLEAREPARVEEYLDRFTELRDRPSLIAGLLETEYRSRRAHEPDVSIEEYHLRFPELSQLLNELLQEDATALGESSATELGSADEDNGRSEKAMALPNVPGFEVIEELGRGGMGIVYRAVETRLGRQVALKTLRPGASGEERERLKREAKAAATLKHPNVVPVHQVFEHDGQLFVVSEYLPGGTLATKIGGNPLAAKSAAALIETMAVAVADAHLRGIIHRDLKPSNVLLAEDGSPKIADFGLAKRLNDDSELTRTGVVAGSPSYMAPEQAAGQRDVGPAADTWALGAILYELLTGRPPFRGPTSLDTLDQVRRDDPVSPRQLVRSVPRDLETICLKCLSKEPASRYPSAAALAEDLSRYRSGESILAKPAGLIVRSARWAKRHRTSAVLLTTGMMVVVAGAVGLSAHNAELGRLNSRLARTVVARDEALVEQASARDRADAARQQAESSERIARRLLFASDMRLAADAVREGDLVRAAELLDPHQDDDLGEAAFVWNHLNRLVHAPGRVIDQLGGAAYFVCFSPDGKTLAACGAAGEIRLYEAGTWKPTARWSAGQGELNGLAFSPDGHQLASSGDDGSVVTWDLRTHAEVWRKKVFEAKAYQVAYALGGSVLAVGGSHTHILLLDAATAAETNALLADPVSVEAICVSPNGNTLVAATWESGAIAWDLHTGKRQWTHRNHAPHSGSRVCISAAISRDGRHAAIGRKRAAYLIIDLASGLEFHGYKVPSQSTAYDVAWCRTVTFLPESGSLVAASDASIIHLASVDAEAALTAAGLRKSWLTTQDRIACVAASNDDTIVVASRDGAIALWTPKYDLPARHVSNLGGRFATWVARSNDKFHPGFIIRSGETEAGGFVQAVDLRSGRLTKLPDGNHSYPFASSDGRRVFTAGSDGELSGWDMEVNPPALLFRRRLLGLDAFNDVPSFLSATRDGRRTICRVRRNDVTEVILFDGTSGETVASRSFAAQTSQLVGTAEDGSVFAFTHGKLLMLLDPDTLATRRELAGHQDRIVAVALTPDGQRIVTAGNDREVIVWDATSGEPIRRWQAGPGAIVSVDFSRGGESVLTATDSRPPRLWDVETGRLLMEPGAVSAPTSFFSWAPAKFTADGSRIVVGGKENVLIIDGRRSTLGPPEVSESGLSL